MSENIEFDANYYNVDYFKTPKGKKFHNSDGTIGTWSYANPTGDWHGCKPISRTWKDMFNLNANKDYQPKVLDVGCGRGTFISYLRAIGVETYGFDFSTWAIANPHPGCNKSWIVVHDATKQFPYGDSAFEFIICLDLMEHMYADDIDKVINELVRVSKKWIFLQIATVTGLGNEFDLKGYILNKGDKVPIEYEAMAVAGHVTVKPKQFWIDKLMTGRENKWKLREDKVSEFISKVPSDIITNWLQNTIIVLEKI